MHYIIHFSYEIPTILTFERKSEICNCLHRFYQALVYVMKYKHKEKVDNVYITEEFRKIDMVREAQGQPSLLPLLPKERKIVSLLLISHLHFD